MEEAFDPENPTRYPKYPRLANLGNATGVNTQESDFWIRNASYLRVKNIQLGYSFGKSIVSKMKLSKLKIYVGVENALTFTKFKGFDPEFIGNNNAEQGVYNLTQYPQSRSISFGLNVGF